MFQVCEKQSVCKVDVSNKPCGHTDSDMTTNNLGYLVVGTCFFYSFFTGVHSIPWSCKVCTHEAVTPKLNRLHTILLLAKKQ